MRKRDFHALLNATFESLMDLTATKGEEYAHDDDQLANFKRLATELGNTPEENLWVYFTKHKDSIVSYIKDIKTGTKRDLSEPIDKRIDDAILYLVLLKAMAKERGQKRENLGEQVRNPILDDLIMIPHTGQLKYQGPDATTHTSIMDACHQKETPSAIRKVLDELGAGAAPSIEDMQKDIATWANAVFPNRTAHGSLAKLVLEEIPEFIMAGMKDPLEYADLVIMILDIAHLQGINVGQALIEKMAINKQRVWRVDEETGFLKHVDQGPWSEVGDV